MSYKDPNDPRAKARTKKYWETKGREKRKLHRQLTNTEEKKKAHADEESLRISKLSPEKKEEIRQYNKTWREQNKDWRQNYQLEYTYGITLEDKKRMYESQEGLCKLCGKPLAFDRYCFVDHSHKTNEIRGLVHMKCNTFIGYMEKDIEEVVQVLNYLGMIDKLKNILES